METVDGFRYQEYERCTEIIKGEAENYDLDVDGVAISGGFDDRVCQRIVRFNVSVGDGNGFVIERVVTDATRVYATDNFKKAVTTHMALLAGDEERLLADTVQH